METTDDAWSTWTPTPHPPRGKSRLLITGSRGYPHGDFVRYYVWTMVPFLECVIHGNARGVDRIADEAAKRYGVPVEVHIPDWDTYGKRAGPRRNCDMVHVATDVVGFWDGESRGTRQCVGYAKDKGKLRVVYGVQIINGDVERLYGR